MRILFFISALSLLLTACDPPFTSAPQSISYIDSLRQAKNAEFINSDLSPLDEYQRKEFKGLNYYPIDVTYKVEASLAQYEVMDTFEMPTTTNRRPLYLKYGFINFKLNGKFYALEVYKNVESMNKPGHENDLFVPFKDQTSGTETYGGGRYLDLVADGPQMLNIDFNLAYNPYCAYNHKYSCPLPPEANFLKTEIRAGEKTYDH